MRRRHLVLLVFCIAAASLPTLGCHRLPTPTGGIASHPSELEYPELKFSPTAPEIAMLPNGLKVYLYEDHDVPLVVARALTRVGSIYEPADKLGLASLCGEVMRTGGAGPWTGSEVDEQLEFVSAELGNSIGQETADASLDCRTQDLDLGLRILAEMLRRPRFETEKLEIAKANRLEGIRRRNDEPGGIAQREFMRLLYGKKSPWARIEQPDTIRAVSRDDLVAFHARYFHPNNMILGVSGDFERDAMLQAIRKYFGDWERADATFPMLELADREVKKGVYVVERDLPQSVVVAGHFGYRRLDPAQLPLTLFNQIFGTGGFSSRLTREIRSNRGLAYSAWAYIAKGTDVGSFRMACETKAPSTLEAIEAMIDELRKVKTGPIEQDEFDLALESETNQFVFLFDSSARIVSLKMDLDFYGYPRDWLETYLDRLRRLEPEDVLAAAQKFLEPDDLIVLVVGDPSKSDKPLSSLGLGEPIPLELDPVE
ncbi:insulinase family protein [Candidatus Sumerlaeota bacterium]|nr:insulinase family protein [Candidatus Sumerlaeota bacterium]